VKNIRATLFFRARASCSKIINVKGIFPRAKNFWATLFFRANASCSKVLNVLRTFNTVKNSRAALFFRASAGCSKLLNNKKCVFGTVNSGNPLKNFYVEVGMFSG